MGKAGRSGCTVRNSQHHDLKRDPEPAVAASSAFSGTAPLVLGILGLLIPGVGGVLAVAAIVLGNSQLRRSPMGTTQYIFGLAGWILGIIELCMLAVSVVLAIAYETTKTTDLIIRNLAMP